MRLDHLIALHAVDHVYVAHPPPAIISTADLVRLELGLEALEPSAKPLVSPTDRRFETGDKPALLEIGVKNRLLGFAVADANLATAATATERFWKESDRLVGLSRPSCGDESDETCASRCRRTRRHDAHVRTTVTLTPEAARLVEQAMRDRGLSFTDVVNEAIVRSLGSNRPVEPFSTPVFDLGGPRLPVQHALQLSGGLEDAALLRKTVLGK